MRTGVCFALVLGVLSTGLGCYEANDPEVRPAVLVLPTAGLVTSEAGLTATFTVVLQSRPSALVTIDLASSNPNEGTVLPLQLVFTPANWNVAQTVTVTGVNDADPVVDGPQAYTIVTTLGSADPDYAAIDPADVSVTNADDDVAGITITPTTGLTTTEAGGTAQFTVVLDTVPAQPVTISFTSSDTDEGRLSSHPLPLDLTFQNDATALNTQTVTITGVPDSTQDGNAPYTIVSAAAVSTDPNYSSLNPADVSVTNTDINSPGILVTPSSLIVAEGSSSTLSVVLSSQPAVVGNVVILVSSSNSGEVGVSAASLTFTDVNWNNPQTVTVTPVDDGTEENPEDYTITFSVDDANTADPAYDALADVTVAVTVQDNDGGQVWTKSGSNPVLTTGGAGAWDAKYVQEPSVLPAAGPSYVMWYEGQQKGQKRERIGRATNSNADGITWTKDPAAAAVLANTGVAGFDRFGVGDPCMVLVGTTYMLWYGGRENAASKDKIGLATSPNGIDTWTRNANPVLTGTAGQWDLTGVGSPHVLYNSADTAAPYRMWYTGNVVGTKQIGYATSMDGVTWTKPLTNAVLLVGAAGDFDADGVMMACVILDVTTYRMWYTGLAADGLYRIGCATSPDGTTWTKDPGNPVLLPGAAGSWDAAGVMAPWVIKEGTALKMWYTGQDAAGTYRIGYATSSD